MEIDLKDYECLEISRQEAYHKAAVLLGLNLEPNVDVENMVNNYIDVNYVWQRDDEEYQYMGYDSGYCYMGGDIKKGVLCGEILVIYLCCPNYKVVRIYKKKS